MLGRAWRGGWGNRRASAAKPCGEYASCSPGRRLGLGQTDTSLANFLFIDGTSGQAAPKGGRRFRFLDVGDKLNHGLVFDFCVEESVFVAKVPATKN